MKKWATKPQGLHSRIRGAKKPSLAGNPRKKNGAAQSELRGHWIKEAELARLRDNLREAQETLDAIRSGEVDAVVVSGARGNQIYSLTSAEEPYRVYVEQMQEGAVTVSAEAMILYCNQRFADMMQIPLERMISSQILDHLSPEAWEKISRVFNANDEVVKDESVLQRADGSALPVNLTASRLPMENQNVMCLVVTDMTEQKKHAKLLLAKELAEKASLAKDDFLAALSHELRTPLTPVLMTAMALEQNEALPKEARESLAMIRQNVELEARLIDDLLDLTRIVRGKLELQLKPTDFHAVVHRAMEICRSEFIAKSQKITLNLNAQHFRSNADQTRIQQAIWNLIRNAAKFSPPGGSIIIRTTNPSRKKISIEVQDTGIGFEPGSEEKMFQAFEQGGRHITRQFGGLGLGLAITRSIIEAHGGAIQAHSQGLGKGATFSFEIPIKPVKMVKEEKLPAAQQKISGRHILLVEDHKDTRNSLEWLLKKNKHDVKVAASAKEALKLAEEYTFDLVISDIGLPDQSGLELMAQLRDKFGLKGIGLSGYGMEEDIAKGLAAGFVHHLTKPVKFDQLNQVIAIM
ncbi:MAG TPA: ATP-binding protein [Verrucomicrobiae bacterium]